MTKHTVSMTTEEWLEGRRPLDDALYPYELFGASVDMLRNLVAALDGFIRIHPGDYDARSLRMTAIAMLRDRPPTVTRDYNARRAALTGQGSPRALAEAEAFGYIEAARAAGEHSGGV